MKTTAILNEVELSSGTSIFVQINGKRASISIDGSETNISVWLTQEELRKLADMINKSLAETL